MTSLASKKQSGGKVGDTFSDMEGVWEIRAVYSDGRYAWALTSKEQAAKATSDDPIAEALRRIQDLEKLAKLIEDRIESVSKLLGTYQTIDDQFAAAAAKVLATQTQSTEVIHSSILGLSKCVSDLESRIRKLEEAV